MTERTIDHSLLPASAELVEALLAPGLLRDQPVIKKVRLALGLAPVDVPEPRLTLIKGGREACSLRQPRPRRPSGA